MVKFYLKNTLAKRNTVVLMTIFFENDRMKLSTGCSVDPRYWMEKKQRAKYSMEYIEAAFINDRLDQMEIVMNSLLKKYRDQNYLPSRKHIREDFLKLKDSPVKDKGAKRFWDFFEDFVADKKKENDDVRHYNNSLRKHLKKTEERMGKKLSFEMIGLPESKFCEEWHDYLTSEAPNSEGDPGLSLNTIGNQNKNLKAFLNWYFDKNLNQRFSLKGYPTVFEDVDKVYLTEEELVAVERVVLDDILEQKVRDLFLIGCETALRFSDFIRIDKDDIENDKLHFIPKKKTNSKTNNKVIIPLSARFKSCLEKYDGVPPHFDARRITDFNRILRVVCQKAGIAEQVIKHSKKDGKQIKLRSFKYDEVSSHTCRRTFCTLKFLKGMPAQAIMKFSGHKTERNFLRYLKLDAELTARKYGEYF